MTRKEYRDIPKRIRKRTNTRNRGRDFSHHNRLKESTIADIDEKNENRGLSNSTYIECLNTIHNEVTLPSAQGF